MEEKANPDWDPNRMTTVDMGDGRTISVTARAWNDALGEQMLREEREYERERRTFGRARMGLKRRLVRAQERAFEKLAEKGDA